TIYFFYLYNPKLATQATKTRGTPFKNLEYKTDGTPTSIVFVSASANPKPTGMKSAAFCVFIANRAGKAKLGGTFPLLISTPINVPNTLPITPPGPSKGLRKGKEQINPIAIRPQIFPASGDIISANKSPTPEPWIIPIKRATKPIKGI